MVHHQTLVGIKASHVLQVIHLTLEKGKVVCKHLPVKLLSDELFPLILVILRLSSIVEVVVERDELVPLFCVDVHVAHILFTHIQKVLSTGKVVKHDGSPCLIEELLLEVVALIKHFLDLLTLLWKHVLLGFIVVISHLVNLLDECWVLHLPLLVVLLLEQFELFLFENLVSPSILDLGTLDQKEGFLETSSSLLSLILELRIEVVIDEEPLMYSQLTSHAHQVTHSLIQVSVLRDFSVLLDQLLKVVKLCGETKVLMRHIF